MKKILFTLAILCITIFQFLFGQEGWIKYFPGKGIDFVNLDANCQDSSANFYLENTETANMTSSKDYMVVEDAILLMIYNFQLLQGQKDSLALSNNISTFSLIAEQEENAPSNPYPTVLGEDCGTNSFGSFSIDYINQFSLGDNIPYLDLDRDCNIARASYDPNDNQDFPTGYTDEHFIRPNTDLEYKIQFQNTGTDTAFTVVIRDQISPLLDLSTIRPGASSHPYEWKLYGDILEFTFNSIMLPDSNVNEPLSHGFIEFTIAQQKDLPEGEIIKNEAAIFFNFNAPVITNETFHTIGLDFITVSTQRPILEDYSISVRPNPLQDFAVIELKKEVKNGAFELYNVSGEKIVQKKFSSTKFKIHRFGLLSGVYFYKVSDNENAINSGKLIIN